MVGILQHLLLLRCIRSNRTNSLFGHCSTAQRAHLDGVDDAGLEQVLVRARRRVVAHVLVAVLKHLLKL